MGTPQPGLNSTTSDNGFLLLDSDLFGADANYDAAWVENSWVQTVDPIDCSDHPYVSLSFQTRYRCWDNGASDGSEKCFVEISRDGTTWPSLSSSYVTEWQNEGLVDYGGEVVQCRYEVFPDSETGYQTDNPSFVEFDITEAAGAGHDLGALPMDWNLGYSWESIQRTKATERRLHDNYVSYTNYAQTGLRIRRLAAQPNPHNCRQAPVYNVAAQTNPTSMDLDVNGNNYVSNIVDTLG